MALVRLSSSAGTRAKNFAYSAAMIASSIWLVAHIVLTVLYVLPVNPLQLTLWPSVHGYVGRFFQQNWHLFAPNPLATNYAILVRPLSEKQHRAMEAEQRVPTNGWYDISSDLWDHLQKSRFSAYHRLMRPQLNGVLTFISRQNGMEAFAMSCREGDEASCSYTTAESTAARRHATRLLSRLASAFVLDLPDASRFDFVAVRIRQRSAVPWSERKDGVAPTSDFDVGVFALERDAARIGLYVTGN